MSLMMSILSLWIVWHVFSNPTASMGRLYSYLHLPSQFIYHKHKRFMWVNIPFVPWMIWLFSKDLFKKTFYYMGLTTVWGRYIWNICMLKCFRPTIAADNGQLRPSQLKKTLFWTNSINNHMGIYKKNRPLNHIFGWDRFLRAWYQPKSSLDLFGLVLDRRNGLMVTQN